MQNKQNYFIAYRAGDTGPNCTLYAVTEDRMRIGSWVVVGEGRYRSIPHGTERHLYHAVGLVLAGTLGLFHAFHDHSLDALAR